MPTLRMLAVVLVAVSLCGCADFGERFQRFEAWKMEAIFGPPPAPPPYGPGYYGYQPGMPAQQPLAAPVTQPIVVPTSY